MTSLTLDSLHIHPVKSCAGLAVEEALLTPTGLQYDREWVVVDAQGEFVSQRELPRLALVRCRFRLGTLMLEAPGMLSLHLRLDSAESQTRVTVWGDEMDAFDMGSLPAQWFSDFLGRPGLRLAAFDSDHVRLSESRWSAGVQARNAFSDGFPLLVTSTASLDGLNQRLAQAGAATVGMERFRPNLVLHGLAAPHEEDLLDTLTLQATPEPVVLKLTKPCARCSIPDVDPATGVAGRDVGRTLQGYRADARVGGALTFGMNAVILSGVGSTLRAGARVEATRQGGA